MARKSEQKVVGDMQSVSPNTRDSLQELIRQHRSELPGTQLQDMLANANSSSRGLSVQEQLFNNLQSALSLTDPYTKYSVQTMLELAEANGNSLDDVLGIGSTIYKASITIDNTKVSGTANLSNFPVLISGTYDGTGGEPNLKDNARSDGYDIRFYSDSGLETALNYELVSYDNSTGTVVAYVRVPTLDYDDDTVIYMGYGDPNHTTDGSSATTWSEYSGVWHLEETSDGTSGEYKDATETNNGTGVGGYPGTSTGQVGTAQSFNGSDDGINFGDITTFDGYTKLTISAWLKSADWTANGAKRVAAKWTAGQQSFLFQMNSGDQSPEMGVNDGTNYVIKRTGTRLTDNAWVKVDAVWDGGTTMNIYIDGSDFGALTQTAASGTPAGLNNCTEALGFGYRPAVPDSYLTGEIDEVRFSDDAKTADWLATAYNSEDAPSTFYTMGSEESV